MNYKAATQALNQFLSDYETFRHEVAHRFVLLVKVTEQDAKDEKQVRSILYSYAKSTERVLRNKFSIDRNLLIDKVESGMIHQDYITDKDNDKITLKLTLRRQV